MSKFTPTEHLSDARPVAAVRWRSGSARDCMDCESAAMLRSFLTPVFAGAQSWPDLLAALRGRGYWLAVRGGRLVLTDLETGADICTGGFLGMPLAQLAARLGRPCLRTWPGADASGDFRH